MILPLRTENGFDYKFELDSRYSFKGKTSYNKSQDLGFFCTNIHVLYVEQKPTQLGGGHACDPRHLGGRGRRSECKVWAG